MTERENILAWLRREPFDHEPDVGFTAAAIFPQIIDADIPVCERPSDKSGYDVFSAHWTAAVTGCHWTQDQDPVLKDICNWRSEVHFPHIDRLDWEPLRRQAQSYDRENKVVCFTSMMGCFERMTSLTTFTDCLTNILVETDAFAELVNAIADYKISVINRAAEIAQPDVICYHDDWGTMRSPFMSHDLWREVLFAPTKRIVDAAKKNGMAFCLHSCGNVSSLIPDMIELGVDVWEGQNTCNDLPALYKQYNDDIRISLFSLKMAPPPADGDDPPAPPPAMEPKAYMTPFAEKPEFLW